MEGTFGLIRLTAATGNAGCGPGLTEHYRSLNSLTFRNLSFRLDTNFRNVLLLFVNTCSFSTLLPNHNQQRPQ